MARRGKDLGRLCFQRLGHFAFQTEIAITRPFTYKFSSHQRQRLQNLGMSESSRAKIRLNDQTLTKEEQRELLRDFLPACQPQEGTPQNTFTQSELDDLRKALPSIDVGVDGKKSRDNKIDICDFSQWNDPVDALKVEATPQDALDWHGAPRFHKNLSLPRDFRAKVRKGEFTGPTNGVCPGFLQCNLVVLPQGPIAFDFLLFCQRNPKACPLIEVCDVGSPFAHGVAPEADLRTDLPKYAIYRDGKVEKEVTDVTEYWPEQSVAFLIGCSFSYDGPLLDAGIPLKSAEQGKNVPMYKTSLKCRPAGSLKGNMVVSMKPIPAMKVSKHIEITSKYTHAHGGPVSVGGAMALGIQDISKTDWGEPIDVSPDEIPVFHACGVTPQNILMECKVPFAITHSAGHMFVTDLPSDLGV